MILTAASAVYHEALLGTPTAQAYLQERGVSMPLAQSCRLGYSDGTSLRQYLERHRLSLKRARDMGLFWRDGWETLAHRIVIPELRGGQCIWMIGRALDEGHGLKYRGLSLPKPILGYERVRGRPRVFVTEGAFDYLTGLAWGLPICALLGTQVRAERLMFLRRARRVLLLFDSDEAGQQGAAELAERIGPNAVQVPLPDGAKDLNDLGRRPDGRTAFFQALKAADARATGFQEAE